MSGLFGNFNLMSDGPKVVLFIAALALWISSYNLNQKSIESLQSNNLGEVKNNIEQMRNLVWGLYAVYLLHYFLNVYSPVYGMVTGSNNIGVIGVVLTTILVVCITHVANICTDDKCDVQTVASSLDRANILLGVLLVVHVGTLIVFAASPVSKLGFTAEIMELLRSKSLSRGNRSRKARVPFHGML